MWEKEIEGRRVLVDKVHALSMQRYLDSLEFSDETESESDPPDSAN